MAIERWKEELETYRSVEKMFILEGNINDMHMVGEEVGRYQRYGMNAYTLEAYLNIYLKDKGYRLVVFYNRLDGFYTIPDELFFDEEPEDEEISYATPLSPEEILSEFRKVAGIEKQSNQKDKSSIKLTVLESMNAVRAAIKNTDVSVAIVIDAAGQLFSDAEHLDASETESLMSLMFAAKEAGSGQANNLVGWLNNIVILLTNKVQEFPAWFYRYLPVCKVLNIERPDDKAREFVLTRGIYSTLDWTMLSDREKEKVMRTLVAKTDGFTNVEMRAILEICENKKVSDVEEQIRAFRHGRKEDPWQQFSTERLFNLDRELRSDVKGQDKAVKAVVDIINRAAMGLTGLQHSSDNRPRGVMFFAGDTGTGKTELAKSLARNIFGAESALVRFDMSEYSQSHSDQRLLGAPPGYVGYDAGGELTNAMKAKPFSILLFDEIEKAHSNILDKFLQILDDGRITDSKGETVYFTECIIIFTSNIGIYHMNPDGNKVRLVEYGATLDEIERKVKEELNLHWRSELLNRIGENIIVFDNIREDAAEGIFEKQLKQICSSILRQRNVTIQLTQQAREILLAKCKKNLVNGGRGIGNVVEHDFLTPLSRIFAKGEIAAGDTVIVTGLEDHSGEINLTFRTEEE